MKGVQAVILARGARPWLAEYALELRETQPLLNVPFAQWQVEALREGGIRDTWIVHSREAAFPELEGVRMCGQDIPLGTAGALVELLKLREELEGAALMVAYGSSYIDPRDVSALVLAARAGAPGWGAIVGVIESSPRRDAHETVAVDADGQLGQIYRKHASQERRRRRRLSGLILLAPEALRCIPADRYFDLKDQLFPALQAAGLRIGTVATLGTFSVLSPEDYLRLQFDLLNNWLAPGMKPRVATCTPSGARVHPSARMSGHVDLGDGCEIGESARIIGPVLIGRGCHIEAGATIIGPTVLGDACCIGKDTVVQCSGLGDGVVAGSGSNIRFSLLGKNHKVHVREQRYYIDALFSRVSGTVRGDPLTGRGSGMGWSEARMNRPLRALDLAGKRTFDIVMALAILLPTAPLWLAIALAIRLDSRGPVLFRQKRCGLNGREFWMLKFRTMVADADEVKQRLVAVNEVDGPMFKLSDDPRITRVGRFLRKTSLDELPQVINVLRNEMSMVGPRPLQIEEIALDPHWRDARLSVKPGITGPWQVYARSSRGFHGWITHDLEYVRKRSFWFDLKIMAKTLLVVFRGA